MSGVNKFEAHYLAEGVMGGKALAVAQCVIASDYDRDTQAMRYALDQWQCNSRENKRIAEENSARADRAEAERDELRAQVEVMRDQCMQCLSDELAEWTGDNRQVARIALASVSARIDAALQAKP